MIVYCTGYRVTFPFFDEDFISAPDNDLPLFKRVFKPDVDNLAFIGLLQPLGAIMPLAEAQGRWVAAYLRGEYRLPPRADVEAAIKAERERMFRRYVASKRHTMQVDYDNYLHDLGKELKAGARAGPRDGFCPAGPAAGEGPRSCGRVTGAVNGKRERTKAQNRATIIAASREVFAELGYDASGVRDVMRRTGLASGTFYNYFEDKEAVFRAVVDESAQDIRRRLVDGPRRGVDAGGVRRRRLSRWFEFLVEDELMFELMQRNTGRDPLIVRRPDHGRGRAGALRGPQGRDRAWGPAGPRRRLHGRRDGRRGARARGADGRADAG